MKNEKGKRVIPNEFVPSPGKIFSDFFRVCTNDTHIWKMHNGGFFLFSTTRGVVRGGQSFDKLKNVPIFKWAQRIQFSRYLNNFNCTWKIFYRRINTIFLLLSLWRIFGVENASKSTKSVKFQRMYASIFLKIGPSIPVYVTNIVLRRHVWYISSLGDTAF